MSIEPGNNLIGSLLIKAIQTHDEAKGANKFFLSVTVTVIAIPMGIAAIVEGIARKIFASFICVAAIITTLSSLHKVTHLLTDKAMTSAIVSLAHAIRAFYKSFIFTAKILPEVAPRTPIPEYINASIVKKDHLESILTAPNLPEVLHDVSQDLLDSIPALSPLVHLLPVALENLGALSPLLTKLAPHLVELSSLGEFRQKQVKTALYDYFWSHATIPEMLELLGSGFSWKIFIPGNRVGKINFSQLIPSVIKLNNRIRASGAQVEIEGNKKTAATLNAVLEILSESNNPETVAALVNIVTDTVSKKTIKSSPKEILDNCINHLCDKSNATTRIALGTIGAEFASAFLKNHQKASSLTTLFATILPRLPDLLEDNAEDIKFLLKAAMNGTLKADLQNPEKLSSFLNVLNTLIQKTPAQDLQASLEALGQVFDTEFFNNKPNSLFLRTLIPTLLRNIPTLLQTNKNELTALLTSIVQNTIKDDLQNPNKIVNFLNILNTLVNTIPAEELQNCLEVLGQYFDTDFFKDKPNSMFLRTLLPMLTNTLPLLVETNHEDLTKLLKGAIQGTLEADLQEPQNLSSVFNILNTMVQHVKAKELGDCIVALIKYFEKNTSEKESPIIGALRQPANLQAIFQILNMFVKGTHLDDLEACIETLGIHLKVDMLKPELAGTLQPILALVLPRLPYILSDPIKTSLLADAMLKPNKKTILPALGMLADQLTPEELFKNREYFVTLLELVSSDIANILGPVLLKMNTAHFIVAKRLLPDILTILGSDADLGALFLSLFNKKNLVNTGRKALSLSAAWQGIKYLAGRATPLDIALSLDLQSTIPVILSNIKRNTDYKKDAIDKAMQNIPDTDVTKVEMREHAESLVENLGSTPPSMIPLLQEIVGFVQEQRTAIAALVTKSPAQGESSSGTTT